MSGNYADDNTTSVKQAEQLQSANKCVANILLTDLPHEIFIHIVSFLDVHSLITLSNVCRLYRNYLNDEDFWRMRLVRQWPFQFPALSGETIDWKEACIQREEVHRRWSDRLRNFDKIEIRGGLSQCVDAVHLRPDLDLLFVGSRDRYLSSYSTAMLRSKSRSTSAARVFQDDKTHKGWIWRIVSQERSLFTTAWDRKIRFWNITDQGLTFEREITLSSAVLDGAYFDSTNCVIATTYDKSLYLLDTRLDQPVVSKASGHQGVVLRICCLMEPKYFVSGGEDGFVFLWDSRNCQKPVDGLRLNIDNFGYPRCMALQMESHLWVGDSRGLLHLFRVSPEGLTLEYSYTVSSVLHLIEVRCLGVGAIVTASQRELIRIWHPTRPPVEIGSLQANTSNQDLASMSVSSNALAVGAGNGVVTYWTDRGEKDEMGE